MTQKVLLFWEGVSSDQFCSVPWLIGSSEGTWGMIQQRSSFSLFCRSWSCPTPSCCSCVQVGDEKKFSQALGFKSLDPFFFSISRQGPSFSGIEEDGGDKSLVELELVCKVGGAALQDPVKSGHCCHCWGNPDAHFCWTGVTSSNFWPFMLILTLMLYVLLVMILCFWVRSWSLPLLPRIILCHQQIICCTWTFHQWRHAWSSLEAS